MIPAPPGSVATYTSPDDVPDSELPVVAFDDDGWALVCGLDGVLIRAREAQLGSGRTFSLVHVPTTDPIVHVEPIEPRRALLAGNEELVLGWAITATGETLAMVDFNGTPWVRHEPVGELTWE